MIGLPPTQVDVGHVLIYFGRPIDGGRIVQHVALVVRQGIFEEGKTLQVCGWPPLAPAEAPSTPGRDVWMRSERVDVENMAIGWIGDDEDGSVPDVERLETTARDLQADAYSNWDGRITDILYDAFPARRRRYFHQGNGQTIEYAFKGSCVGFVEECFEAAKSDVVAEDNLPPWPGPKLAELLAVMPIPDRARKRLEEKVPDFPKGIPLLLPGYQLMAFTKGVYPHTPASTDEAYT